MFAVEDRSYLTRGKRSSSEEGSGRQAGARAEAGADGAVDGEHQGAWMGKERPMPYDGVKRIF